MSLIRPQARFRQRQRWDLLLIYETKSGAVLVRYPTVRTTIQLQIFQYLIGAELLHPTGRRVVPAQPGVPILSIPFGRDMMALKMGQVVTARPERESQVLLGFNALGRRPQ